MIFVKLMVAAHRARACKNRFLSMPFSLAYLYPLTQCCTAYAVLHSLCSATQPMQCCTTYAGLHNLCSTTQPMQCCIILCSATQPMQCYTAYSVLHNLRSASQPTQCYTTYESHINRRLTAEPFFHAARVMCVFFYTHVCFLLYACVFSFIRMCVFFYTHVCFILYACVFSFIRIC